MTRSRAARGAVPSGQTSSPYLAACVHLFRTSARWRRARAPKMKFWHPPLLPIFARLGNMSGASGSHDAQITFNSVECALLDISSSGRTPTNIAKPILSALLQHSAPCSGPLVLAGCIALVGNATVYDQQLIAHAINATMHALGAEDIARLSYEALGVREILSSVEAVAASALDALGVPACVSESQFWRLSLPAIFGLIYGGVEPGCDVPALRSFREQLLLETENKSQAVTSEPLEGEQTGEEVLEEELAEEPLQGEPPARPLRRARQGGLVLVLLLLQHSRTRKPARSFGRRLPT